MYSFFFLNYNAFPTPYPTDHENTRLWMSTYPGTEVLDTNWILLPLSNNRINGETHKGNGKKTVLCG